MRAVQFGASVTPCQNRAKRRNGRVGGASEGAMDHDVELGRVGLGKFLAELTADLADKVVFAHRGSPRGTRPPESDG